MRTNHSAKRSGARSDDRFAAPAGDQGASEVSALGDGILPSQYFGERGQRHDGLRRLMFAVLEDAIRTCLRCAHRRDRTALGQLRDVMYWIERDDSRGLFSFVNLCEMLELDAHALRHKLYEICDLKPSYSRRGWSAHREMSAQRPAAAL